MTPTNVELYEALKPTVGQDAARMIAEAWPPAGDVATKSDLGLLKMDIEVLKVDIEGRMEGLRGEIHAESSRTIKWMLGFFVPVWAGTWATALAVLLKS